MAASHENGPRPEPDQIQASLTAYCSGATLDEPFAELGWRSLARPARNVITDRPEASYDVRRKLARAGS